MIVNLTSVIKPLLVNTHKTCAGAVGSEQHFFFFFVLWEQWGLDAVDLAL